MGIEIKKNEKGLYSLKSTISDESYHLEKDWISEDEVKKKFIEQAFYRFVEKTIQIDMEFPNNYFIDGRYCVDKTKENFNEWYLEILKDDNYGKKLFQKFNEVLKKHNLDLNTEEEC